MPVFFKHLKVFSMVVNTNVYLDRYISDIYKENNMV